MSKQRTEKDKLSCVLVTDCGSTTTKALLFQKTDRGWRQTYRGEAPTTVENPVADVTVGALNAFHEIQELSQRQILDEGGKAAPFFVSEEVGADAGIDLYLSTSSAGGGLQMIVSGIVQEMSTQSAARAALGAGAIVLDEIAADDGREDYELIERIRHIKPDIVLIAGGVDGGSQLHPVEMAETLRAAAPKPRFGETLDLPVIFAGNKDAGPEVKTILDPIAQVSVVDNVRPALDQENVVPAREAIHEFFLSHVMSHSPGYGKLLKWTPIPVMPTPAAVGDIVQQFAQRNKLQVLCADIGGATTDVFSVCNDSSGRPTFNRTVSANLGMSYSVANVLLEAGPELIARWLPFELSEHEVRDRLRNKMIRPTSIPQTKDDLWVEQAVCREALRLSLEHHRSLAVGLSGNVQQRSIGDVFSQTSSREELLHPMSLDLVIGSGGVLSHAPKRLGAALMMLDGFGLEGFTEIAVDSIFMMPHLGILASVHPEAAEEIFVEDCLVRICHSLVPVYKKKRNENVRLAKIKVDSKEHFVEAGKVTHIELEPGKNCSIEIAPLGKDIDCGAGSGQEYRKDFVAGNEGLLLDGRNRPFGEMTRAGQEKIFKELAL